VGCFEGLIDQRFVLKPAYSRKLWRHFPERQCHFRGKLVHIANIFGAICI